MSQEQNIVILAGYFSVDAAQKDFDRFMQFVADQDDGAISDLSRYADQDRRQCIRYAGRRKLR